MIDDWIDTFMERTKHSRSPEIFRLWTAIVTISAVLERKCWTETDVARLYPNQFVILAGAPAAGKGVSLGESRRLLGAMSGVGEIYLGPDNPTPASMMDEIAKAEKPAPMGMGVMSYSPITILSREFASMISKYDKDYAANLADLYDNPLTFSAPRRSSKSLVLQAPTINIIAAATPDTLMDTIPEQAWGQGLTSRIIFVYGLAPNYYRDPFRKRMDTDFADLQKLLRAYYNEIHGEFIWEVDAQDLHRYWINEGGQKPKPDYGRLANYVGRRAEHLQKLAMVSAVSAGHGCCVTLKDYTRAQEWLFAAEKVMPDMFRAMSAKSDSQIITDMHHWMYTTWGNMKQDEKSKGVHERRIYLYLQDRVPNEKIGPLIKTMESSGRMRNNVMSKGFWIPSPMGEFKRDG